MLPLFPILTIQKETKKNQVIRAHTHRQTQLFHHQRSGVRFLSFIHKHSPWSTPRVCS